MEDRYLYKAKTTPKEKGEFNNVWVTGNLIVSNGKYYIHPVGNVVNVKNEIGRIIVMHEVIPDTICQCTGLKDKNGNLIWENDIIHKQFYIDYDAYANSEAYTGRIQYEYGGWSVEITKSDGSVCVSPIIEMIAYSKDIEHFEVIGNIFDNPELLQ
jgi:uncharacterized phage protein (TIGR01671 family)